MTTQYVDAAEFEALKREHKKLQAELTNLARAAASVQRQAYDEGRKAARAEYLRARSPVVTNTEDGIAELHVADNGGKIQFHTVGPMPPHTLTGGLQSPAPDFLLRIWGPPVEGTSYGVHEQGGHNATDFSMAFDLTEDGIQIHRMDIVGLRPKWSKG